MAHKIVRAHFEKYSQARLAFVRAVADCGERPEFLESLLEEDVFTALRPMLHDSVVTVQSTAALALGRIANFSAELAGELVRRGLLVDIVDTMAGETAHAAHLKAGAFVLRCVAKHTSELAGATIDAGCVPTLASCLEQLDVGVREAAAAALTAIACHDAGTASAITETGAVPLLCAALQEPEPSLKRTACMALGEVAAQGEALARQVVAGGALPFIVQMLRHGEVKVRRHACITLGSVVKHSTGLAEAAVDARIFPAALVCLQDADAGVRRAAAVLVRDVVKHGVELAKLAAASGSLPSLIEYATTRAAGSDRLPATMALGFTASFTPELAQAAIDVGAVPALKEALLEDKEAHLKAAAVWSLGQVGKHSSGHANALASADVLRRLLAHSTDEGAGLEDLQEKSKRCLRAVLAQCSHIQALQALLGEGPPPQLQVLILSRILEGLRSAPEERRGFLGTGGLKMAQALAETGDGEAAALVDAINGLYPPEVVEYVRPQYAAALAERSAAYNPAATGSSSISSYAAGGRG
jgi:hypothetical protein